jgi:hypothetical protein
MVSMGTVWDRTAEFLSDNLGRLLPLALGAIFVPSAISGSLSGLQQGAAPGLAAGLGLASLLLAIVTFWGQLAITALALDPAIGRGAARAATRRLPAALAVTVVLFLALFLLAIPAGIILAASGADLSSGAAGTMPQIPAAAAPWLLFYFLVLIPVAVWLGARLLLVAPVIVGENTMFGAVPRSWALTRGSALRIVGVLILYAIVAWIAYLAATTAFGAIITLVAGRGEDGLSIAMVLTGIVGGTVSTAFTVLRTAFTAKLYLALRAAKEPVPA